MNRIKRGTFRYAENIFTGESIMGPGITVLKAVANDCLGHVSYCIIRKITKQEYKEMYGYKSWLRRKKRCK